jgi:hypothetical protein
MSIEGMPKVHYASYGSVVFSAPSGRSFKPLKHQVQVLFGIVAGLTNAQPHLLWGDHHQLSQRLSQRLDMARKAFVEHREKTITFGGPLHPAWVDVEADEVDLAKELVENADSAPKGKQLRWEQWAGIVQRGRPETLVLYKTNPKLTKRHAPGLGPIKKTDWTPMAAKLLKGRRVFLQSDGARSYKLGLNRKRRLDGVIHDYVVHKKKKVRGKWIRPKYVQLFRHIMPDGSVVCTKGGTHIIDWCWQHLRQHMGHRHISVNRSLWSARVRSAQWEYWSLSLA